ncbi:integrase arm-type DNA-binding domain-containing protein [Pseudoxanthomonas sp. JBR18]|uniref:tyrosine-type recombinase/integrase n=1 Tax=Pseudoxanthomonas sp. JBR18 TaxID=2969308 RepID=UPI002304D25B|nr:integrase arm-type DNA-binding domain-containing protein [Pseudoxanthomonas sp. JBR18]WCE03586.1 tyrosine-type recombinase/integrase [Pseudoxanthomonas sp. JBR18]
MASDKLNALMLRTAPVGKHFDGGGLFFDVQPGGGRYWRMKYRFGELERLLAIGVYPEVSLAEARRRREQARACLRDGLDPMAARRAEQRHAAAQVANKFEALAREWILVKGKRWTQDYRVAVLDHLEKDAFPKLGRMPVSEITPGDILGVVRAVEARGALTVAARVLGWIRNVLTYGVITGRLTVNPARDLQQALVPREQGHHAALPFEEVGTFLPALDTHPGKLETRIALELVVHTFLRSQEVRLARWSEFDPDAWNLAVKEQQYWWIPGARMKMRRDHMVPLSRHVRRLLARLHPLTGQGEFLFPHRYGGKGMSKSGLRKAMAHTGFTEATVHGFRALASTELNERGFREDAIERQLAHVQINKVRRIYNRAKYRQERCDIMTMWSELLEQEKQTVAMMRHLKAIALEPQPA